MDDMQKFSAALTLIGTNPKVHAANQRAIRYSIGTLQGEVDVFAVLANAGFEWNGTAWVEIVEPEGGLIEGDSFSEQVRGVILKHAAYLVSDGLSTEYLLTQFDEHVQSMAARIEQLSNQITAERARTTRIEKAGDTPDDLKMRYHDRREDALKQNESLPDYQGWLEDCLIKQQQYAAGLEIDLAAEKQRALKAENELDDLQHDVGVFAYCGLYLDRGDKESLRSDDTIPLLETWEQMKDRFRTVSFRRDRWRERAEKAGQQLEEFKAMLGRSEERAADLSDELYTAENDPAYVRRDVSATISGLEDMCVDLVKLVEKRNRHVEYWKRIARSRIDPNGKVIITPADRVDYEHIRTGVISISPEAHKLERERRCKAIEASIRKCIKLDAIQFVGRIEIGYGKKDGAE